MKNLLHIAERARWTAAQGSGSYRADCLDNEGFIHYSTADQLIAVANDMYRDRPDLPTYLWPLAHLSGN